MHLGHEPNEAAHCASPRPSHLEHRQSSREVHAVRLLPARIPSSVNAPSSFDGTAGKSRPSMPTASSVVRRLSTSRITSASCTAFTQHTSRTAAAKAPERKPKPPSRVCSCQPPTAPPATPPAAPSHRARVRAREPRERGAAQLAVRQRATVRPHQWRCLRPEQLLCGGCDSPRERAEMPRDTSVATTPTLISALLWTLWHRTYPTKHRPHRKRARRVSALAQSPALDDTWWSRCWCSSDADHTRGYVCGVDTLDGPTCAVEGPCRVPGHPPTDARERRVSVVACLMVTTRGPPTGEGSNPFRSLETR